MPTRKATARWEGGLQSGHGSFKAASGAFEGRYSVPTRFGDEPGTNPEELLAAAHAACFSMALSGVLERQGNKPQRLQTEAACTVEKQAEGFKITKMELTVRGQVDGADADSFRKAAEQAKDSCPVSGAFRNNLDFELDATLE